MKLSIKEINQKILAKEEERIRKEKIDLELKKLKQAENRKKAKLLSDISENALDAALNGNLEIEISSNYPIDEIKQIYELAEKYFFNIEERDYSESIDNQLRNHIKNLDKNTISTLTKNLSASAWRLRDLCDELKKSDEIDSEYEASYAVDLLDECLNPKNPFDERVISANLALSELENLLNYLHDPYYSKIFDEELLKLTGIFPGGLQFRNIDENAIHNYLIWDEHTDDDVFNYEPASDYFNVVGLSWIASSHGQLFVSALNNLIDQKINCDESSLLMYLFKDIRAFRIVLENGSEVYTLLDEKGLLSLFTKLGYKVDQEQRTIDEISLKMSWNKK